MHISVARAGVVGHAQPGVLADHAEPTSSSCEPRATTSMTLQRFSRGERAALLDAHGVADVRGVLLVVRLELAREPDDPLVDRVPAQPLDADHDGLVHLVGHHAADLGSPLALPSAGLLDGSGRGVGRVLTLGHHGQDAGDPLAGRRQPAVVLLLARGEVEADLPQLLLGIAPARPRRSVSERPRISLMSMISALLDDELGVRSAACGWRGASPRARSAPARRTSRT